MKFKHHAGEGLGTFDDLDLWLWAVESENWAALNKLLLRRGDPPMTVESRNRLADLLRVRVRRQRGRPTTEKQKWQLITRMMLKRLKTMTVCEAAKDVADQLPKLELGWRRTQKQIENRWKKGKR